jgi:Flp pilus assembly protein TadG
MRARRVSWRGDGGSAAIEFAIVLPILVMLVFGIVSMGQAYNTYLNVTAAAREAARALAVGDDAGTALARFGSGVQLQGSSDDGDQVSATVIGHADIEIPGVMTGKVVELKSTATMRKEAR